MSRFSLILIGAASFVACAKSDKGPDTTAAVAATPVGAAAAVTPAPVIDLAQMEGTWHGKSMPEGKDTVINTWTLVAPADTSKWVTTFRSGQKVPMHIIAVAGDSVVSQLAPYKSASVQGQMVNVRLVARLQNGKLVGVAEARLVSKPDSVTRIRIEGTK
jgi:predicted SnoaL-like aldol condensation-catalyzing enzyme